MYVYVYTFQVIYISQHIYRDRTYTLIYIYMYIFEFISFPTNFMKQKNASFLSSAHFKSVCIIFAIITLRFSFIFIFIFLTAWTWEELDLKCEWSRFLSDLPLLPTMRKILWGSPLTNVKRVWKAFPVQKWNN